MKRVWGIICGSLLLCAAGGSAAAQSWDGAVAGATELSSQRSLGALFWSEAATCANAANDLAARQCKGIRAARKAEVSKGKYLVRAEAGALSVEGKDKRALLTVRGCLACKSEVEVGGKKLFVVAGGAATMKLDEVIGPVLGQIDVPNDAAWNKDVLPRLRTEVVISLASPAKQDFATKAGTGTGYSVTMVGYRVVDPCDGSIIVANPKSPSVKPDKRYCTGKPVEEKPATKDPEPDTPKAPELPAKLSSTDIRNALEPAREAARKCFEAYGIAGTAMFRITINNEGEVAGLRQKGDFTDTPTGACIEKAVKAVVFPKSRKNKTTIDYPFILR